jgi:L-lactate dehydrogenase (cytochrome)
MGRPFMYALTYGEEGVRHAIDSESLRLRPCELAECLCHEAVVRDEIQTTMRLLGVTKLSQLGPHLVRYPPLSITSPAHLGSVTVEYKSPGPTTR